MKKPKFSTFEIITITKKINDIKKNKNLCEKEKDKHIDIILRRILFYRNFFIKEKFKKEIFVCKHLNSCLKNSSSKCFGNNDPETNVEKIKFVVFLVIDFFTKKKDRETNNKQAKTCFKNIKKYRKD